MSDLLAPFVTMPSYGLAGLVVLLLYAVQAEIRFGKRARTSQAGPADRKSTLVLKIAATIVVLGFVFAIKTNSVSGAKFLPQWFRIAVLPGLPFTAWLGVALGVCGIALRLWAVLTLRERYSRTLLIQEKHTIERGGPYRWVRHPGYLGSLLALNGVAIASGNWVTLVSSLVATLVAYNYRIRVEDQMLVEALGTPYAEYRRQVGALLP